MHHPISGYAQRFIFLSLLTALVMSGCQPAEETETPTTQNNVDAEREQTFSTETESIANSEIPPELTSPHAITNLEREGVRVVIASWEKVQEFIANQKGKIVVVDIWSTWCYPCVKEYPHLVELQKKYPKKVVCISLNINFDGNKKFPPESNAEEILDFLVEKKSKLHNFISSTPDEDIYKKINLAAIPVAYVYDTNGVLKKRFDNEKQEFGKEGFSYEKNITPLVEEMLKEVTP